MNQLEQDLDTMRDVYMGTAQRAAYDRILVKAREADKLSDHCRLNGCLHAAHGCPTWPAGVSPFAQPDGVGK